MEYNQLIAQLTPEVYLRLKTAIEIGKWPDGRVLSKDQKASCMEAVLRYQTMKLDAEQHSGFMPDQCASSANPAPNKTDEQVIKIH
ncbi:MAG: hypothetical protein ACI9MN_001308 [Saprospiraceae bacterium]|jgi:uncharacterized protein YeaC (DUF1315 family)|tara:strand:- start:1354 stop:1611 length:258 start_codon:yes stop_codon:yes gene_type:complete